MSTQQPVRSALSLLLRPFSRVRPDEAVTVVLMTLASFLLLTAYYRTRSEREGS